MQFPFSFEKLNTHVYEIKNLELSFFISSKIINFPFWFLKFCTFTTCTSRFYKMAISRATTFTFNHNHSIISLHLLHCVGNSFFMKFPHLSHEYFVTICSVILYFILRHKLRFHILPSIF